MKSEMRLKNVHLDCVFEKFMRVCVRMCFTENFQVAIATPLLSLQTLSHTLLDTHTHTHALTHTHTHIYKQIHTYTEYIYMYDNDL